MFLTAAAAHAAPSYDCAKASNAAEKFVCDDTELQWFDRQLARLYKLARDQAGAARETLVTEQRRFIVGRDSCGANYECLFKAYETRLTELKPRVNLYEAYAKHKSPNGTLWVVRFGFDAAIMISTIGGGDHLCAFRADSAPLGGKGVIRWRGQGANACRIDIVPEGDDLRIETRNCQDYCGARATLGGLYSHAP